MLTCCTHHVISPVRVSMLDDIIRLDDVTSFNEINSYRIRISSVIPVDIYELIYHPDEVIGPICSG